MEYSHVVWQIEPTAESLSDYDFYVLRSGGQAGPYEVVGGPLVDQYIWRDNRAREGRVWAPYYYRIRVVNRATSATEEYGARTPEEVKDGLDPGGVSRDPDPPFDAREAIYRMRLLLNKFGRSAYLFQRRVFGQRCSTCWDEVKSVRTVSQCQECFDTGFVTGFFRPITTRIILLGNPGKSDHLDGMRRSEPTQKRFRFSGYPEVKPQDIVVDSKNGRWRANIVEPSYRDEALVSQVVTCSRVPKTDVEYKLPIRGIDPIRVDFADELNFRPAYNLEALTERRNRYHPPEV